MKVTDLDVVVVGAGIGGMSTALLLARAGASVTLLEQAVAPTAAGAGILLQPNGLAVLSGLGLIDPLEEAGHRVRASVVHGADGSPVATLAVPDFGAGLDHLLAVGRPLLYEVLSTAVSKTPAIDCRFGATAKSARPDGSVDLEWLGRRSTIEADLVVGADGIGSTVREGGEFGVRSRPVGTYLRALVPRRGADIVDLEGEYWTSLGLFGGAPVDAATCYFYCSLTAPPVAAAMAAEDLAALRAAWADVLPLAGELFGRVGSFSDLLVNRADRIDCRSWHDGNLVLLGDAAHAMAPTLGQGANSALVDAAVLTASLAASDAVPAALERYTQRRRRPVVRVQDRSERLARLSRTNNRALTAVRDAGFRALERLPGSASRLVRGAQQEDPAELVDFVAKLASG